MITLYDDLVSSKTHSQPQRQQQNNGYTKLNLNPKNQESKSWVAWIRQGSFYSDRSFMKVNCGSIWMEQEKKKKNSQQKKNTWMNEWKKNRPIFKSINHVIECDKRVVIIYISHFSWYISEFFFFQLVFFSHSQVHQVHLLTTYLSNTQAISTWLLYVCYVNSLQKERHIHSQLRCCTRIEGQQCFGKKTISSSSSNNN